MTPTNVSTLAAYNSWQNALLNDTVSVLAEDVWRDDQGLFFKSIFATLNHVLWADRVWLSRLDANFPSPGGSIAESVGIHEDWITYAAKRIEMDFALGTFAMTTGQDQLDGEITFTSATLGGEVTRPTAEILQHVFNHQTHHRGQVHAVLTRLGVETWTTDMIALPDELRIV